MSIVTEPSIKILPSLDAISQEAAWLFTITADKYISSNGRFSVAVSGGSTPLRFFESLAASGYSDRINWSRVHFFWVDERCVPRDHQDSNFKGAWDALLSRLPIPGSNIHRIKGETSPADAALEYEDGLRKYFGDGIPSFDIMFLGMGEDGHTASLFPGSELLNESNRLAAPVYVEKLNSWRVTLTLPVLNNAKSVLFLVSGENKAGVLKEILESKSTEYPAGLVKPNNGSLTWLVDRDAAGGLKK